MPGKKKTKIWPELQYSIRQSLIRGQELLNKNKRLNPGVRAYLEYTTETLRKIDELI